MAKMMGLILQNFLICDLRCPVSFHVDIFETALEGLGLYQLQGANFQTHFEPLIMVQNLAVILQQLCYSKTSFAVLNPDCLLGFSCMTVV